MIQSFNYYYSFSLFPEILILTNSGNIAVDKNHGLRFMISLVLLECDACVTNTPLTKFLRSVGNTISGSLRETGPFESQHGASVNPNSD